MKKSFSRSKVVENPKGGKESKVDLSILIEDGSSQVDLYDWRGEISVNRNGFPFREEGTINGAVIELLDSLCTRVRERILATYSEGCNVAPEPIISFLETSKEEFVRELKLPDLKRHMKRQR